MFVVGVHDTIYGFGQKALQLGAALHERQRPEISAITFQQIERHQHGPAGAPWRDRRA